MRCLARAGGRALGPFPHILQTAGMEEGEKSMLEYLLDQFVWPLVDGIILIAIRWFIERLTGRRGGR